MCVNALLRLRLRVECRCPYELRLKERMIRGLRLLRALRALLVSLRCQWQRRADQFLFRYGRFSAGLQQIAHASLILRTRLLYEPARLDCCEPQPATLGSQT